MRLVAVYKEHSIQIKSQLHTCKPDRLCDLHRILGEFFPPSQPDSSSPWLQQVLHKKRHQTVTGRDRRRAGHELIEFSVLVFRLRPPMLQARMLIHEPGTNVSKPTIAGVLAIATNAVSTDMMWYFLWYREESLYFF